MLKNLVKGGVMGGVILFAWGSISWMALPWHAPTLLKFQAENAVSQAVFGNVQKSGMYLIPNPYHPEEYSSPEETEATRKIAHAQMMTGPTMLAAISLQGPGSMGKPMAVSMGIQVLTAFLLTWLLLQAAIPSYGKRVLFVTVAALAAGVACHLPHWNWWGFSAGYTLVAMADLLIGCTLAGLYLAKITTPMEL